MNDDDISKLKSSVKNALSKNAELQAFSSYAPIHNSRIMLKRIREYAEDEVYLRANQDELNVGLLAAKALDFDADFIDYATGLHKAWTNVLIIIGIPFQKPISGPQLAAYNFYQAHKYAHNKIGDHMKGINFNFPVDDQHKIKSDEIVIQWRNPNIPQGDYYAENKRIVRPDCLGVYYCQQNKKTKKIKKRIWRKYKAKSDVKVLKTTANCVLDTWSIKGESHWVHGGCHQYFNYLNKNEFKQTSP